MEKHFKAFIRVVKSITKDNLHNSFDSENIVREPLIMAKDKEGVKNFLLEKYPQFFSNGKVYTKETKDIAQFFYVVIFELFSHEIDDINKGEWACNHCKHVHPNKYISKPYIGVFDGKDHLFCRDVEDIRNKGVCYDAFKREYYQQNEIPDDNGYVNGSSYNYIYKITEKLTNKCYIGKTKNAPFFRWWNHLTHSCNPFGLYFRNQTKLSDWTFEVLEILPSDTLDSEVFKVESNYIKKFDSINNGFNSLISNKCVETEDNLNII
jgi:hypothetical protein